MRKLHSGRSGKGGFTLIEVLIVLVILGAIAAFVVPNIVNRASEAEPTRVAGDLRNIGEALAVFQLDTRGAIPGDLEDLVNAVLTTTADSTITGAQYSDAQANRWDGPYLKAPIAATSVSTDSVMVTGFGGSVVNGVSIYQAANTIEAPGASVVCGVGEYAALRVDGLTAEQLAEVNAIFDGSDEGTPEDEGAFRWIGTSGYYLAAVCR